MTDSNPMNILLVEDDSDIRFAVRLILETAGHRVTLASQGREALEIISHRGLPDLILLDMMMPIMDGWEFAAQFRRLYDRRVPILVMTAASNAAKRAMDIGAEAFVNKPFKMDELLEAVSRYGGAQEEKHIA